MSTRLTEPVGMFFHLTFGVMAILIGTAIIMWICYNEFVHRLPQYTGTHWWEPFGVAPGMIGVGIFWLRRVRPSRRRTSQLTS
jgi:hypothetical protein